MQKPLIFSGSSHQGLAREISKKSHFKEGKIDIHFFPDKETSVQIQENVKDRDVFIVQSTALDPNYFFMELMIIVDALKRGAAKSITAIIPYFGYTRQDRMDRPGVPITPKLIANLLTRAGVSRLITLDLHTPQIEGFFDIPIHNLSSSEILIPAINKLKLKDPIIVAPDIGGIKIANTFARKLNCSMAIIDKERINASEVQEHMFIGDVRGKEVIITDDVCSTAGTLVSAAATCKKLGAKRIIAAVGHGLLISDAIKRIEKSPIELLIATNSIQESNRLNGSKKLQFFSAAEIIANVIKE